MMRDCVVIVGSHRSGTSAMARSMSLLGAQLPTRVIAADPGNPAGHWEPEPLVRLHDRVLIEAGSRWDDWRSLAIDPVRLQRYAMEAAGLIAQEFPGTGAIVIKDPRISRFVKPFSDVIESARLSAAWVVMVRHPLEVCASLAERNNMAMGAAQLVWLRNQLDAELGTRGRRRALVSYDALLNRPPEVLSSLVVALHLDLPRSVEHAAADLDAFLSDGLRHHVEADADARTTADVSAWVLDAYACQLALVDDPDDVDAQRGLDRIRSEFAAVPAAFTDLTASIHIHAATVGQRSLALEQRATEHVAALRADFAEVMAEHRREHRRVVREHRRKVRSLRSKLRASRAQLKEMRASRWWRLTQPARRTTGWMKRRQKPVR